MRDLLVMAVVFGTLPVIPFRPVLGLGVYAWLAYMRPQDLAWGIKSMQLSMWVAIAILVGLVLAFGRERFQAFVVRADRVEDARWDITIDPL